MTQDEIARAAKDVRGHGAAMERLLSNLTRRWVLGTGWVHRSVVRDAVAFGIAEAHPAKLSRGVRISEGGIAVRDFLRGEG